MNQTGIFISYDEWWNRMRRINEGQPNLLYIEKQDPWSSHSIIQKWLNRFPPGTKVLDIGTATGLLGKRCEGFGFLLKGIEPVQKWAEEAKPYYDKILCTSLEQAPDEFLSTQDVVILADVLEHTSSPEKILTHLVALQKPGTQIFISIPNVANIWIRVNLLFGKFNYADNGILDRTHLRFFTKFTFLELLHSSGLNIVELRFTPIPLNRVTPFFQNNPSGRFIHRALNFFARMLPELFAYQFVARTELTHKEQES